MARRWTPPRLLLLLLTAAFAVACASGSSSNCATSGECCDQCGADSYRCARGPCSSNFFMKSFFSISLPTGSVGFWDVVFSAYGLVPYVVPTFVNFDIIFRKMSWARIFACSFIPIVALINALILVKALGDCSECPRPCGSCVSSGGMPSGHATNAVGLALWVVIETFIGFGKTWSTAQKVTMVCANVLVFGPVPYSRVYLGDHTPLQVVIGSLDGVVFGVLYFCFLRFVLGRHLDGLSRFIERKFWGLVIHNDYYEAPAAPTIALSLLGADDQK